MPLPPKTSHFNCTQLKGIFFCLTVFLFFATSISRETLIRINLHNLIPNMSRLKANEWVMNGSFVITARFGFPLLDRAWRVSFSMSTRRLNRIEWLTKGLKSLVTLELWYSSLGRHRAVGRSCMHGWNLVMHGRLHNFDDDEKGIVDKLAMSTQSCILDQ